MVFSSTIFLLYFLPVFLLVYTLAPKTFKSWWILIASLAFYAWGAPRFVFVLLGSTILDYYIVAGIHAAQTVKRRKLLLIFSLVMNLGLLVFFKYANFFVENVNSVITSMGGETIDWVKIALPIGISFYTFQTLTYAIDVYRKKHDPFVQWHKYLVYIFSFPQMIAGPIVRFNQIAKQINAPEESADNRLFGFYRFCLGLGKKVLIANVLGEYAEYAFKLSAFELTSSVAWIGILCYTFQIYFDFAGYSDMAIGLGKMMGLTFPENFDNPYNAKSITEFWQRWHMTLGQWMKSYLYIPLGGNKVSSNRRLYLNLITVFLISGLWHGASWNFILWGAYHGVFLILDRIFLKSLLDKLGTFVSVLFTFVTVLIGWVLFAMEDLSHVGYFLEKMFAFSFSPVSISIELIFSMCVAAVFSFIALTRLGKRIQDAVYLEKLSNRRAVIITLVSAVLFCVSVSYVASSDFNPFIYYRF